MEMRDWVIVFGVLVLVGLAADAYRRIRQRNKIQLKIDRQFNNLPEVDLSGELPGGGKARVVSVKAATETVAVAPQEPSFRDDDLLGVVAEESGRREPGLKDAPRRVAAASDEVDILLDSALQGVGQGAGEYLSAPRDSLTAESQPTFSSAADADGDVAAQAASLTRSTQRHSIDSAALDTDLADDDGIIGAVRIVRTADLPATPTPQMAADSPLAQDRDVEAEEVVAALASEGRMDSAMAESAASIDPLIEATGVENSALDLQSAAASAADADLAACDDRTEVEDLVDTTTVPAASPSVALEVAENTSATVLEADLVEAVAAAEPDPLSPPQVAQPAAVALSAVESVPTLDLSRPVPELLASVQAQQAVAASLDADLEEKAAPEEEVAALDSAPVEPPPVSPADTAAAAGAERDDKHRHHESSRLKKKKERRRHARPEVQVSFFDAHPDLAPEPETPHQQPVKSGATRTRKPSKPQAEVAPAPDEVLVITVMARYEPFSGRKLFKLVEACGLSYGRMNIFHRHEQDNGAGPVQFSMVNAVHPGTFKPDEAADFTTPGVTFFLTMSEPSKLMEAFDCMLATAQCLAENLEGELRDEQRSSLRSQTVEHYRNKVRDFERRRLARRA